MPLRSWPARAFGSALLLFVLPTASAHAGPEAPPPATIAWSAPAECPGRAEVERRVSERLPPDASIAARGRVERVRDGYRLVLEIASRGERVLEATTCESLVSSAAIVIAMSYAPSPAPTPAPSKPAENAVQPPADRAEPPRATERVRRFGARVEATGDVGMLPSPAAGIGAAVGIDPVSRLHVEAFGGGFFSQDATALEGPARGASLTLLGAGLRGCFALTRGIEIAPCLGAEILHLSASGYGSVRVADASSTTWAPEASVGLRVPIAGPLFVRAGVGAFLPMSRQTFVITAVGSVHRPDAVAVRAFVGPELRF